MIRTFRVHKTRGTCKIVHVECHKVEIHQSGALLFWRNTGNLNMTLVMAYAPWAWKTVSEDVDVNATHEGSEPGRVNLDGNT